MKMNMKKARRAAFAASMRVRPWIRQNLKGGSPKVERILRQGQ